LCETIKCIRGVLYCRNNDDTRDDGSHNNYTGYNGADNDNTYNDGCDNNVASYYYRYQPYVLKCLVLYRHHKPLKIRTNGSHAPVRELWSISLGVFEFLV